MGLDICLRDCPPHGHRAAIFLSEFFLPAPRLPPPTPNVPHPPVTSILQLDRNVSLCGLSLAPAYHVLLACFRSSLVRCSLAVSLPHYPSNSTSDEGNLVCNPYQ
jgi:hypothetical protein